MSQVTLQVGGRPYTVSCADGEEDRVRHLAAIVDGKLGSLGDNLAPGDTKNLLFAALLLADEADEARRAGAPSQASLLDDSVPRGLEALADRLEAAAGTLENGHDTP
ncbi:MAG: cell division protein ZapA [Qipengyuania sp.]|nr:cell division protein ZapA [Qipengyuania sp.]